MSASKTKKGFLHNATLGLVVVLFLVGLSSCLFFYHHTKTIVWQLYLLNFLPALTLGLFFGGVKSKGTKRLIVYMVYWLVSIIYLLSVLAFNAIAHSLILMTTPVTDVTKYAEMRKEWDSYEHKIFYHFPQKISKNAKNVEFYYFPAFLQGGSSYELRMKLPSVEIDNLMKSYEGLGVQTFSCADLEKKTKGKPSEKNFTFNTGGLKGQPLPKSYQIIVLGDTASFPKCNWNHGEDYGLAINKAKSEVIFWANNN